CPSPYSSEPEFIPGLHDDFANPVIVVIWAPQFQTRRTSHTVTQCSNIEITDHHGAHLEELQLLYRSTIDLFDDIPGTRSLDLQTPEFPMDCFPHRPGR